MSPVALGTRVRKVRLTCGADLHRISNGLWAYATAPFSSGPTTNMLSAIGGTTVVTVRYFAAARAAAGVPSEDIDIRDGATVADALEAITSRHGDALRKVLAACSFLVDSVAVRDRTTPLRPGAELDVLPPFAGG